MLEVFVFTWEQEDLSVTQFCCKNMFTTLHFYVCCFISSFL